MTDLDAPLGFDTRIQDSYPHCVPSTIAVGRKERIFRCNADPWSDRVEYQRSIRLNRPVAFFVEHLVFDRVLSVRRQGSVVGQSAPNHGNGLDSLELTYEAAPRVEYPAYPAEDPVRR